MFQKNDLFACIYLLMFCPGLMLCCGLFTFADELATLAICMLFGLELWQEGWEAVRRHRPFWILSGIALFYVLYSVLAVHFNTPKFVLVDTLTQFKPFIVLLLVARMGVSLPEWARQVARWVCWLNMVCMIAFFIIGGGGLILPFGHIVYLGANMEISAFTYLWCSIDREGRVSLRDKVAVVVFMTVGLLCGRSKFFAEYLLVLSMLFFYRPGILRAINMRMVLAGLALVVLIVLVTWQKFSYYFIEGTAAMADAESLEEMSEAFARPLLYYVGGNILVDYFPFGSGLASFASDASAINYSGLYYEYGLDKMWGLSPSYSAFVTDAYYPTLCQFGFVGLGLFVYFWYRVMRKMNHRVAEQPELFRYPFILAVLILFYVLIESIGGTLFVQGPGVMMMMMMGMIFKGN